MGHPFPQTENIFAERFLATPLLTLCMTHGGDRMYCTCARTRVAKVTVQQQRGQSLELYASRQQGKISSVVSMRARNCLDKSQNLGSFAGPFEVNLTSRKSLELRGRDPSPTSHSLNYSDFTT